MTMLLAAALTILPGCARQDSTAQSEYNGNLVAAYVGDGVITEGDVTAYIDEYRQALNLADDAAWADYLTSTGESAQDYREKTINQLAIDRIFEQAAAEHSITADTESVDQAIASMRSAYNALDDDTWKEVQQALQLDEKTVRKNYESQSVKSQVYEAEVAMPQAGDEDIVAYIDGYLIDTQAYNLLRLSGTNYLPMQNELVRIQSSPDSLAAFNAAQLNGDESAENYMVRDDVGWILADGSSDSWLDVMEGYSVPGLRDYLYFDGTAQQILYASDPFTFTDGTRDIANMPVGLKDALAKRASQRLWDDACKQWLADSLAASLKVNDAPMNLPYEAQ